VVCVSVCFLRDLGLVSEFTRKHSRLFFFFIEESVWLVGRCVDSFLFYRNGNSKSRLGYQDWGICHKSQPPSPARTVWGSQLERRVMHVDAGVVGLGFVSMHYITFVTLCIVCCEF
jgi:hypothetical protein